MKHKKRVCQALERPDIFFLNAYLENIVHEPYLENSYTSK